MSGNLADFWGFICTEDDAGRYRRVTAAVFVFVICILLYGYCLADIFPVWGQRPCGIDRDP